MSKHRAPNRSVRRRGRISVLGLALGVTIAVGGSAVAVLPQLKADPASAEQVVADADREVSVEADGDGAVDAAVAELSASVPPTTPTTPAPAPELDPELKAKVAAAISAVPDLPEGSGEGRRIVFDQTDQRVWLVGGDDQIERTYLVSGSRFDNLQPGAYAVQSRSRTAIAFDYTGTMEYFVRFTSGDNAPIGFHSVPRYNNGELEQTKAQLGTPLSAGCVRQWMPDAIALWEFAPVGTKVHVTP